MLLPGNKIGIIGGGQLGKMLAVAANTMGYQTIVLDEAEDAPAFTVANTCIVGKLTDYESLEKLVTASDVVTYEFENIDAMSINTLQKKYQKIPQGAFPLYISQNRVREKEALAKANLPLAPYKIVYNIETEFSTIAETLGFPYILKTQEGGYDGKGQVVIKSNDDFDAALTLANIPCVAEAVVPFDFECSIIAVRNLKGDCSFFPIAKNEHRNNILYKSTVSENLISAHVKQKLETSIETFMNVHNIVGIITFEAFVIDEEVLINEIAPRPHNSGHYTIEGCMTSQFEQQIRAICGLPLGSTELIGDAIMYNILGQHKTGLFHYLERLDKTAHLHLYGKTEYKLNRKMGHITFMNASKEALTVFEKEVLKGV